MGGTVSRKSPGVPPLNTAVLLRVVLVNESEYGYGGLVDLGCICKGRNTYLMLENGGMKMNLEENCLSS